MMGVAISLKDNASRSLRSKVQNGEQLLAWINWALSRYIMDQKMLRGIHPKALCLQKAINVVGH
jgi:hypothetical protein